MRLGLYRRSDELFHLVNSQRTVADVEAANQRVLSDQFRPKIGMFHKKESKPLNLTPHYALPFHGDLLESRKPNESAGRKQVRPGLECVQPSVLPMVERGSLAYGSQQNVSRKPPTFRVRHLSLSTAFGATLLIAFGGCFATGGAPLVTADLAPLTAWAG